MIFLIINYYYTEEVRWEINYFFQSERRQAVRGLKRSWVTWLLHLLSFRKLFCSPPLLLGQISAFIYNNVLYARVVHLQPSIYYTLFHWSPSTFRFLGDWDDNIITRAKRGSLFWICRPETIALIMLLSSVFLNFYI